MIKKTDCIACVCERCGNTWTTSKTPQYCWKCKSPYWNKPRRVKKEP